MSEYVFLVLTDGVTAAVAADTAAALLREASRERIAAVAGRATTDGPAVLRFAMGVVAADTFVADVDALAAGTVLRVWAVLVDCALRPASGDCVWLGEEAYLASADGHAQRAHLTIRIRTARIRCARIFYTRELIN